MPILLEVIPVNMHGHRQNTADLEESNLDKKSLYSLWIVVVPVAIINKLIFRQSELYSFAEDHPA